MTSATPYSDIAQSIRDAAVRLSPAAVHAIEEIRRGGNSRVFRVITADGDFALKKYPRTDDRDRQGAEKRALEFFERVGPFSTPLLIASDPVERISLLSWIEGRGIDNLTDAEVEEFASFQIRLACLADAQARREIGAAAEACVSGKRIIAQTRTRFDRLACVRDGAGDLGRLLDGELRPALDRYECVARQIYADLDIDFDSDLPRDVQILIASDYGAHNALRGDNGRLWFVDFEYFGWDDPITSVGNFIFHPGMRLSKSQQEIYLNKVVDHLGDVARRRMKALLPLIALRWCAIILGEFLPERWAHRLAANPDFTDWEAARRTQIDKARRLFEDCDSRW
jgi:hypothetical protein